MTTDARNLTNFLNDPESLACTVSTAVALQVHAGDAVWPIGWTAWGTNALGEERTYGSAKDAHEDEVRRLMLARTVPLQFKFQDPDASTRDDFACQTVVTAELRINDDVSDLKAFRARVLGSRKTFLRKDLCGVLEAKAHPLIRAFVRGKDAGDLVDDLCAEGFQTHFRDGMAPFLFESGLTLCGAATLRCVSPQWSHERQQRRRADREKRRRNIRREVRECQQQAAEHHLEHLEQLLDRVQSLADRSGDLDLADLVRTFSEQERAEIYEALFKLRPPEEKTARVVAASAEELTLIDPARPDPPARRLPIEGRAGLLRSVRLGRDADGRAVLLAGARNGVYLLGLEDAQPRQVYRLGENTRELKGGVNSVALSGDELLASHSEVGLIRWALDKPDAPTPLLAEQTRNAEAVRHVTHLGDSIWVTIDHRVLRLPADDVRVERAVSYEGNAIPVTALYVDDVRVLVGTQTGRILSWELDDPSTPQVVDHGCGRPVESVRLLAGRGLDRLIFADSSPGIPARFLDDAFACRYQGGGQELRRVFVAEDLLVGVNTQRDRLLLWHPHEPAEPFAQVPVARWTGHSVQDVCLIPQSAES